MASTRVGDRWDRAAAYTGVLAVVLWVIGVAIVEGAGRPGESATDAQILASFQDDANWILAGGWIFMIGCLAFLWFAVMLRDRLAQAEGGSQMFSNVAFVGAFATAAFGLLLYGPSIAAAIREDDISAASAGSLNALGDAFFVAAEISAALLMFGFAGAILRTGVFPKAWAWISLVLGIVLLIGPIGWAGLIFGLPLWVLGTSFFLVRGERREAPRSAAMPT